MTKTGTRQFAAFIMKYVEYNTTPSSCPCCASGDIVTKFLPVGWRLIGEGSYRWAFVGPDGFVYKVDKRKAGSGSGNMEEAANFERITRQGRLPERVYIPDWTLYEFTDERRVLVMEKVETDLKFGYCDTTYGGACGCSDLNMSNVFADMLSIYKGCWSEWMDEVASRVSLWDLHEDNLFPQSDGRVALIDAGM